MRFLDRASAGSVKRTKEGYLVATARVARTGVQEYLASELGDIAISAGFNPNDIVRLHRDKDEVFHADSLVSITRLPVTVDHPADSVTANNWADLSVGDVGDAYSIDNDWIVVNPMIKDVRGVTAAQATHREISMGYTASIVKARDGVDADFEMRDIRYNHLALVPAGRAGHEARIGDAWGIAPLTDNATKGSTPKTTGGLMTTKTVVLGDKAVQVLAEDAAEVERFKAESAKTLTDAESVHAKEIATKDAELEKLQAQLDDAKSKILSDAEIDAKAALRADLIAAAKKIAPTAELAGLSDAQIRKAVVTAKLGDTAIADKSDAYIDARFDILAEDAMPTDSVRQAINAGITPVGDSATAMKDAHSKSVHDINAWRKEA